MGQQGGHCILPQKLFAVVVPEAFGTEMLRAEASVGGWDEVFHAQALHPFAGKLRLAERKPDTQKREETDSNLATDHRTLGLCHVTAETR